MGQNQFIESLVEVMLSWMRWLTSWFWSIANSENLSGGFLGWFSGNWKSLAVFLIVAGVVVDWIVWMIRWRPYWIWTRKRQIIYEEVPVRRKRRPEPVVREADEYDDPFSEAPPAPKKPQNVLDEWDIQDDPYAAPAPASSAASQPHFYGRPRINQRSEKQ